jgi:hypothetical protein
MRACKKDANHDDIVEVFQFYGYIVINTFSCHGILLDFIAYKENCADFVFVEVKNGNKKLTEEEEKFIKLHAYNSIVIKSIDDAMEFCFNRMKK